MKTAIQLQQTKKCIILFMVGIICSALAYVIYVIDPLKLMTAYTLQMKPNSFVFSMWRKPSINVYLKVYLFNITNPVEFLKGEEKLKLEEVGPYVYQEFLENHNVTWHENNTISYIPRRTIMFVPEMSVSDPEQDIINVPNVPLLGISSALHDAGFFLNFPWIRLTNMLNSKPILNMSVYEYLWGYEDSLVHFASSIVPNFINFRKFGLLDRMYDEGDNVVLLNIAQKKDMMEEEGRYLSIETYNGSPGLAVWGYREPEGNETYPENTSCNSIRGATEGTLFPPNLNKNATFRVYRKAFCKAIPIVFEEETKSSDGFEGYLYTMANNFLDPPDQNPINKCYCRKKEKCLKKGLSNITPCYYNIPAAMSLPHFLNADPSLRENIEGLHPDPKKHLARIILQPKIGVPVTVNSRIQINLVMYHTTYNSKISAFNDLTIPLFWSDLHIPSLPPNIKFMLTMLLHVLPVVQTIIICLLGIAGVTTLLWSLIRTLWLFTQQQEKDGQARRDSTDLKIPLSYGQCTTIRILPAFKRITSKTELFS